MCSYNAVNGIPTCADPWVCHSSPLPPFPPSPLFPPPTQLTAPPQKQLLDTLLRKHWNWTATDQYVVSDCGALQNVYQDHHYGASAADAAARSLNAGTDLDCGSWYPRNLPAALASGAVSNATLDQSLVRRYASMVRLGYFDPPASQPYRKLGWADVGTPAAQALARRAAVEGLVLLKNSRGALPLDKGKIKTLGVVGAMANATKSMQGTYDGPAKQVPSPFAAFQAAGFTVISGTQPQDVVAKADAVVYVGGIDDGTEAEDRDRNEITWPAAQLSAIRAMAKVAGAAGRPFVVIQMGTMLDSSELKADDGVSALLWVGYPGQDGGPAMVDVVTGTVAPAGGLSVTQYAAGYTKEVKMTDMGVRPGSGNPG